MTNKFSRLVTRSNAPKKCDLSYSVIQIFLTVSTHQMIEMNMQTALCSRLESISLFSPVSVPASIVKNVQLYTKILTFKHSDQALFN